jgi:hypothetical protein
MDLVTKELCQVLLSYLQVMIPLPMPPTLGFSLNLFGVALILTTIFVHVNKNSFINKLVVLKRQYTNTRKLERKRNLAI